MKYIDAEKLLAEIERLHKEHTTREYRDEAALVLEDLEDYIDSIQQEQKPKVMQEVSDNVDKLRAISTPAEEDWFKISEEWEKEDKKSETDCNDLDEAAQAYANGPDVAWVGTSALECAFKAGAEWAMNHKENKK